MHYQQGCSARVCNTLPVKTSVKGTVLPQEPPGPPSALQNHLWRSWGPGLKHPELGSGFSEGFPSAVQQRAEFWHPKYPGKSWLRAVSEDGLMPKDKSSSRAALSCCLPQDPSARDGRAAFFQGNDSAHLRYELSLEDSCPSPLTGRRPEQLHYS